MARTCVILVATSLISGCEEEHRRPPETGCPQCSDGDLPDPDGGPIGGAQYSLELHSEPAPELDVGPLWDTMAVDSAGFVYITDNQQVYRVGDGTWETHLTQAQVGPGGVYSLDVDSDDNLYLLTYASGAILRSPGPGVVEPHLSLDGVAGVPDMIGWLGAESADRILVLSKGWAGTKHVGDGIWSVEPGVPPTLVVDGSAFGGKSSSVPISPLMDFEVTHDGRFFYIPGIAPKNGKEIDDSLFGGRTDGTDVTRLIEHDEVSGWSPDGFVAVGRDPKGGAVVSIETYLLRVETGDEWVRLEATPTMSEVAARDVVSFNGRPVGVGPDGRIYLATSLAVYRFVPE